MARSFGFPNKINLDPFKYNHCLLGESKIGKTTLVYNLLKMAMKGDEFIFFELRNEDGHEAIEGLPCVTWNTWSEMMDGVDEIIENRDTDWKSLKMIVIDTIDQLFLMADEEAINQHNKKNCGAKEFKRAETINQAWGGYGNGMSKALEYIDNLSIELKSIGIRLFFIGHTKAKDVTDMVTGETYQQITSDQVQKYFNHLKKTFHFLGTAHYDRVLDVHSEDKKSVKKQERVITFRDDNYVIDAGTRFGDIVNKIEFSPEAYLKACRDAIETERKRGGNTKSEDVKLQKERDELENKKQEEKTKTLKITRAVNAGEMVDEIKQKFKKLKIKRN